MNKEEQNFQNELGFLPTNVDHDYSFSLGTIKEAQAYGIRFGTLQFLIYDKLRWYENNGKMKTGISVAGYKDYAKRFGVTEKQVADCFTKLRSKGAVELILCDGDEKVFRNKTRIWISSVRLQGIKCAAEAVEKIRIRGRGNKLPNAMLTAKKTIVDKSTGVDKKSTGVDLKSTGVDLVIGEPPLSEVQMKFRGSSSLSKDKGSEAPEIVKVAGLEALEVDGKLRVVDENGEVKGGNPYTEKAYMVWEEIMGFPLKRDKWNSQAGYNMVRAKDKGAEWLAQMLVVCKEAKSDSKADFRVKNISNLSDLQKNWEYVVDYARQKALKNSKQNVVKLF